jgi:hypothetical protein
MDPAIGLTLIPASDETPAATGDERTPGYYEVSVQLRPHYQFEGINIDLRLVTALGPVIGGVAGAWFHARYGRKVRLKVGELEAEAQTIEEVEKLLERAQEIQQRNQPKVIHEP